MTVNEQETDVFMHLLEDSIKQDYHKYKEHSEDYIKQRQYKRIDMWHRLHDRLSSDKGLVDCYAPHYIHDNISMYRIGGLR